MQVPNLESQRSKIQTYINARRGLLCRVPAIIRDARASIVTLRESSFAIRAPRLFNILPMSIREYVGSVEGFKYNLDCFLQKIPDEPSAPHYVSSAASNCLIDQVARLRLETV